MIGFDDKALILFPHWENYDSRNFNYKSQFRTCVRNLCNYLATQGIVPHVFYTDDVARELSLDEFVWVSTLSKADCFFTSKYCNNMASALTLPTVTFDEVYNKITEKDPGDPYMTVEDRFNMVCRHANKAANQIIPMYKIVIHFRFKNKAQYKVVSKAGDNKIRINVDANNFVPEAFMGGMSMDIVSLLQAPYANRSLITWEC